jgi:hypothetical protein
MRTSDSVAKVHKRRGYTTQADRKTMGLQQQHRISSRL